MNNRQLNYKHSISDKSIKFNYHFNEELNDYYKILYEYKIIIFGCYFNKKILQLKNLINLIELHLGRNFNNELFLPNNLIVLKIGHNFNNKIIFNKKLKIFDFNFLNKNVSIPNFLNKNVFIPNLLNEINFKEHNKYLYISKFISNLSNNVKTLIICHNINSYYINLKFYNFINNLPNSVKIINFFLCQNKFKYEYNEKYVKKSIKKFKNSKFKFDYYYNQTSYFYHEMILSIKII